MNLKKQVFIDRDRSAVIKVFPTATHLQRELAGLQAFTSLIQVPQIEVLDKRVAKIALIDGFISYQINEDQLNLLIANFLSKLQPVNLPGKFSIFEEINQLRTLFPTEVKFLLKLESQLQNQPLFPVHGDMQKQNILVSDGQLCLIDFEHFILAPRELELVNSLFFDDGNCLNVFEISKMLAPTLDLKMISLMIDFYALKQRSFGMSADQVSQRTNRAKELAKKLSNQSLIERGKREIMLNYV